MSDASQRPVSPSSRDVFLQRIRQAFGSSDHQDGRGSGAPDARDPAGRRHDLRQLEARSYGETAAAAPRELARRFARELEALAGEALVVEDPETLQQALGSLLKDLDATRVMLARDDVVTACELEPLLADAGVAVAEAGDAAAQLGITGALAGIAESGTLVLASGAGQGRGVSLVPPNHVALLPMERLVSGLSGALARLERGALSRRQDPAAVPSSINFITGPSRSADLAGDLSLGVHGPGRVVVFILAWSVAGQTTGTGDSGGRG